MTVALALSHRTHYAYQLPVSQSRQLLRLTPRQAPGQRVLSTHIEVSPQPQETATRSDAFGNQLTALLILEEHRALDIEAEAQIELTPTDGVDLEAGPSWERTAERLQSPIDGPSWEAAEFCYPSPRVALDGALEFCRDLFVPGRSVLNVGWRLCGRIFNAIEYREGATSVNTPVAEVFSNHLGVCQDFAHAAIACLRTYGLAARYVSGYIRTGHRQGAAESRASDASHAWFSVWCPKFGWTDFDPTNNLLPSQSHVTLAWGRDYGDVSPTIGFIQGGGEQTLEVAVQVTEQTSSPCPPQSNRDGTVKEAERRS